MSRSLNFPRYGDKRNSPFFEDFLGQLLEERDRVGLTQSIRRIDTLMITVEPGNSLAYVGELCVADGEVESGETRKPNIDHVVDSLRHCGQDFLLDVIGSKEAGLKQIFSSASEYSSLIVEYVQRFGDFQGFFTKDNVAELTHAAGVDESLKALEVETRG